MRMAGMMGTIGAIRTLAVLASICLAGCTTGCIAVGGTDHYTAPTLGRQLQDLKVARDTGAINDAEYNDAKAKLINGEYTRKR